MARNKVRGEPDAEYRLNTVLTTCAVCGQPMPVTYTKTRKLTTCHGLIQLRLQIRHCVEAGCSQYRRPYHPEEEARWGLPEQECGLDLVLRVGQLRYREHRSCPEIHAQLQREGVHLALRTVQNVLTQYDTLLSLALDTLPERATRLRQQGRAVLAIDGLQPDVGHEVLWVVREVISGEILCARSLLSSARTELEALLTDVVATLPVPVAGVVSDGQHVIRDAVAAVLPGVPHQLCQFHYLREAGRPYMDSSSFANNPSSGREVRLLTYIRSHTAAPVPGAGP